MSILQVRYRLKDYQLSDAFRPIMNWGYKSYTIDSEKIGTEDLKEVAAMARNEPPSDRYELFSVRKLPYCDENPIYYENENKFFKKAKPQPDQPAQEQASQSPQDQVKEK